MGNLAEVAAWTAYDAGAHDIAIRYLRFALCCADQANDWSLRATILADMSRQATSTGRHEEGLSLAEFAHVRADRLGATERAMLMIVRARALAKAGHADACRAALDRAYEHFTDRDQATDPPWMHYYDDAQLRGDAGHALFDLAMAGEPVEQPSTA